MPDVIIYRSLTKYFMNSSHNVAKASTVTSSSSATPSKKKPAVGEKQVERSSANKDSTQIRPAAPQVGSSVPRPTGGGKNQMEKLLYGIMAMSGPPDVEVHIPPPPPERKGKGKATFSVPVQ